MDNNNQFEDILETNLNKVDWAVKKETTLLGQSSYPLNKFLTKSVNIGISPAADYIPIVKICGAHTCVFFTEDEWTQFLQIDIRNMESPVVIGDHKITKNKYKEITAIWIRQRNLSIVISEETYTNLFYMKKIIEYKLNELRSLDFYSYYTCILKSCLNMSGDLYMNVLTLISSHKSIQNAYLMLECLHMNFNIMCFDFEMMKINYN